MSTPVIWILFPLGVFVVVLFIHHRVRLAAWLEILISLLLAGLAWKLPLDTTMSLGPLSIKVVDTLSILGRNFTLDSHDLSFVMLIYLLLAFWLIGAIPARAHPLFFPVSLGMTAILVAALAVDPFLYASLLIELAVLLSIPMLAPPGEASHPGIFRFLIFQTLAVPFILFTGSIMTGAETGAGNASLVLRAGVMLGLGFAFLLAVFPFYSWIPLLGERSSPYSVAFVLTLLPTVSFLLAAGFLDKFTWLRDFPDLYVVLRLTGGLMVASGGLFAAFQNHLGRMLGYAVIFDTGFSLIALGLGTLDGMQLFSILFFPRAVGLGIWALALEVIRQQTGSLDFSAVRGMGRKFPLTLAGLMIAYFSFVGLPMLASFPVKLSLLSDLAQISTTQALWVLLGTIGLAAGALRALVILSQGVQWNEKIEETRAQAVLLGLGIFVILIVGIQPNLFYPSMIKLLNAFPNLVP